MFTARDGRKFMHGQQGRKYDASLEGLPKVQTNDPKPANDNDEMEDAMGAPGGDAWDSDYRQHGQAHRVTITHDSTGHHVEAHHKDGHVHHSTHLDAFKAHQAAQSLAGVSDDMAPQDTPQSRARNFEVGPKEDERMKRENTGMGIKMPDGHLPGMGER